MKLIHFTAEWCQPCKMMKPMVDKVIEEHPEIEYHSVDIDKDPNFAKAEGVMGVPTFILNDGGTEKARIVGARTKQQFVDELGI